MESIRIELQNVAKYYYSETAVTQALRKVNLQFRMGEFVAITGESGSGKSTLLKVISGMEPFDEGELYLDGQPTFQYDEDDWEEYRRQKIGFVFQDYSLIGHYTAKENIVSVLLIMGIGKEVAEKKALKYLERVGLDRQVNQKASKLSSGQKQRLSIARALAKNTDIIVADEPTGNLDSETGEQIVKLLQDLSRDHLVIMVTHNYEQVESYVTRKVRLHDGEVVLDIPVEKEKNQGEGSRASSAADRKKEESGTDANEEKGYNEGEVTFERKMDRAAEKKQERRLARFFAGLNLKSQPGKAVLFFAFFLLTATISFMFIGQLLMNADDVFTKEYEDTAYAKEDDTRLSVKRKDGKALTDKDIRTMESMSNVVSVDQYDLVNDINYYYIQGRDYEKTYGYIREVDNEEVSNYSFFNKKHFMRSSTCLKKSDLAEGRLPENIDEIVLYPDGESDMETYITMFFTNSNYWSSDDNFVTRQLKVVGWLKEKSDQVYFSPLLCKMLQSTVTTGKIRFDYAHDIRFGFMGHVDLIPIFEDIAEVQEREKSNELASAEADGEDDVTLKEGEMRVSGRYEIPPVTQKYAEPFAWSLLSQYGMIHFMQYDENRTLTENGEGVEGHTREESNSSGADFAELPEDVFTEYFLQDSMQASVYLNNYAKTDHVIRAMEKAGYDAVSTVRFGAGDYNGALVEERLKLIGIASAVLLVMMIAEILILRSFMKVRIKDQFVMKFMGMRMKLMCKISYVEMRRHCIVAMAVVLAAAHGMANRVPILREMLYYYEVPGYLLFVAYNMVAAMLTVAAFNHLLRGRMDE